MRIRSSLCSALALIPLAGCDFQEFFITYHNIVPQQGCLISPDTEVYRPRGVLDVFAGESYFFFPLLRNELPPKKRASELTDRTEPNLLQLRRYEVLLTPPSHLSFDASLTQTTYHTSGALLPGDRRASLVPIITEQLSQQMRDENLVGIEPVEFTAEITAFAETGLGDEIASQPFIYPLDVCFGCLVIDLGFCSNTSTDAPARFGNTCGRAQDEPVGCCRDGTDRICLQRPIMMESPF